MPKPHFKGIRGPFQAHARKKYPEPIPPDYRAALQPLPTYAIVESINTMIDVLRARGQPVRDWDERDKVIDRFTVLGGKVYALAPREKTTEATDGKEKDKGG